MIEQSTACLYFGKKNRAQLANYFDHAIFVRKIYTAHTLIPEFVTAKQI
jgi:hypothetical protein